MFVSVGHAMTLQGALALALSCCLHRVPEPVRLADKHSRRVMAELDAAVSSRGGVVLDMEPEGPLADAASHGHGVVATPTAVTRAVVPGPPPGAAACEAEHVFPSQLPA